ncbi:MAG TPA: PDZ domain-containing protein, partial [Planctomycetota bacterium]|nr:PDZ domain-containing protein [Planctomycetota bacterium]
GARVDSVVANSPAEKAGILAGDIVLSVDGARVDSPGALRAIELAAEPGRTLRIQVQRGETILEASLAVEARFGARDLPVVARVEEEKAGIRVRDRAVEEGGRRAVAVEIVSFTGKSPLETAGLAPGDLLLSLDERALGSAAEFVARLREECEPGARVRIESARGGQRFTTDARLRGGERVLKRLRLPPLFSYEHDPRLGRTRWWFGDLFVISLFRWDRRGLETEVRILSLFGWTTGEGLLGEEGK